MCRDGRDRVSQLGPQTQGVNLSNSATLQCAVYSQLPGVWWRGSLSLWPGPFPAPACNAGSRCLNAELERAHDPMHQPRAAACSLCLGSPHRPEFDPAQSRWSRPEVSYLREG